MYKYTYRTRGFSIGCQPRGFAKVEQEEHKFETIYYSRELTKKEIEQYELIDLNKKEDKKMKMNASEKTELKKAIYKKQGIKAQGYWQDAEAERLIAEYMQKRFKEELDKRARV